LGQPEQCTIGVLSRRLLASAGIDAAAIKQNVVTETATSSLLIPSVATGAADAALVYLSDAQAEGTKIDVVAIDSPLAQAIQPFGIATSSEQKQLSRLLFNAIGNHKELFEAAGFRWRLTSDEGLSN
jgi:ABC-type molybdate transport system substrate-binding protein